MNTLPMDPEFDDIDLLETVENSFGIRIAAADAEKCETVGDLYEVILKSVRHQEAGPLPCPTAQAFRKLRRAFKEECAGITLRPDTPLVSCMPKVDRANFWRLIADKAGLKLPELMIKDFGRQFLTWLTAAVVLFGLDMHYGIHIFVAMLIPISYYALRERLQNIHDVRGFQTVGDLARVVSAMNASSLAWPGGAMRDKDVWQALVGLIRDQLDFDGPINRDTKFF